LTEGLFLVTFTSLESALNTTWWVELALSARWRACPLRLPECWLGKLARQAPSTVSLSL